MRDVQQRERAAVTAVARRFAATWEEGSDPPAAYLMIGGKRIAVDIVTLERHGTGQDDAAKPRLRFDKVATRLMAGLQAAFGKTVPGGLTVLVTITAPIRLPAKTAAALEDRVRALLARGSPDRDEKDTIHGNRVRVRLLRDKSERAPKMIGFVHNADVDPLRLLQLAGELLELSGATAVRPAPEPAGERWLVVISARDSSCLEAYRHIYSQLRLATDCKKVLMVFGDGHVGELAG